MMTNDDKMDYIKNPKYKYLCEKCDFKSNNKKDFERHLLTSKHKNDDNNLPKPQFVCICGKKYTYRQGLYKHKKTCIKQQSPTNLENLICELINENKEFKNLIIKQQEQINELIPKVGNNNKINSNNKFNINVFLNEQCKDAISINEFVKSVQISMENLLTTKNKGLSAGLNDIINENMSKLSLYERPIHCTDKKRETLYVKYENWEKDIEKTNTNSMLKSLQIEQIKNLHKFKEAHPNYEDSDELKHEYMLLLNKCTKSLNEIDKKLFKNLCDITYLSYHEKIF